MYWAARSLTPAGTRVAGGLPSTAAKRLGICLPTAPHPRLVVAQRLGASASGPARAGAPDAMTTAEIQTVLEQKPARLVAERATHAAVHEENARLKAERAAKVEHRKGGSGL